MSAQGLLIIGWTKASASQSEEQNARMRRKPRQLGAANHSQMIRLDELGSILLHPRCRRGHTRSPFSPFSMDVRPRSS